ACTACAQKSCCSEAASCGAECDIKALTTPTSIALAKCLARDCAAECSLRCEDLVEGAAVCKSCRATKCCGAIGACINNTACATYRACIGLCASNDALCAGRCATENPSASSAYVASGE